MLLAEIITGLPRLTTFIIAAWIGEVTGCVALAGKLFPGPHLYAGAAITVTWALAAALVPAMTRGNDAARTAHITLNVVNIGLFAWQIPTGFAILQKVFQFTTWP